MKNNSTVTFLAGLLLGLVIGVAGLFILVKHRLAEEQDLVGRVNQSGQEQMTQNYQAWQNDQNRIAGLQKQLYRTEAELAQVRSQLAGVDGAPAVQPTSAVDEASPTDATVIFEEVPQVQNQQDEQIISLLSRANPLFAILQPLAKQADEESASQAVRPSVRWVFAGKVQPFFVGAHVDKWRYVYVNLQSKSMESAILMPQQAQN